MKKWLIKFPCLQLVTMVFPRFIALVAYVFPRLQPVYVFPQFCFPAHKNCSHVFPRMAPVACFPALSTCFFWRLPSVTCSHAPAPILLVACCLHVSPSRDVFRLAACCCFGFFFYFALSFGLFIGHFTDRLSDYGGSV